LIKNISKLKIHLNHKIQQFLISLYPLYFAFHSSTHSHVHAHTITHSYIVDILGWDFNTNITINYWAGAILGCNYLVIDVLLFFLFIFLFLHINFNIFLILAFTQRLICLIQKLCLFLYYIYILPLLLLPLLLLILGSLRSIKSLKCLNSLS